MAARPLFRFARVHPHVVPPGRASVLSRSRRIAGGASAVGLVLFLNMEPGMDQCCEVCRAPSRTSLVPPSRSELHGIIRRWRCWGRRFWTTDCPKCRCRCEHRRRWVSGCGSSPEAQY